jgi:hypothetical protein
LYCWDKSRRRLREGHCASGGVGDQRVAHGAVGGVELGEVLAQQPEADAVRCNVHQLSGGAQLISSTAAAKLLLPNP